MTFCRHCGTRIEQFGVYCQQCGAKLDAANRASPQSSPEPGVARKPFPLAVIGLAAAAGLAVLLLALTGVLGGSKSASDEDQIISLIKRSESAFNDRDWIKAYSLLSPATQSTCTFEVFRTRAEYALGYVDERPLSARDINVAVNGNRAIASYDVYAGNEYVTRTNDDAYSKEGGHWYDEADSDDGC